MVEHRRRGTQNTPSIQTTLSDVYTWKYPPSLSSEFSQQSVLSNTLSNQNDLCDIKRPNFLVGTVVVVHTSPTNPQCSEHIMCVVLAVDRSIVHVGAIDTHLHEQAPFSVDFFHIHQATDAEIHQFHTLPQL